MPTAPSDPTVAALCQSVNAHFERSNVSNATIKEAFVASLYGPWGIGKTHVLRHTEKYFDEALKALASNGNNALAPIVPVFFSAWRFEKEPHLIVPLVKTIELTLRQYQQHLPVQEASGSQAKTLWQKLTHFLGQGATGFGNIAAGLTGMFKVKAKLDMDATQAAALGLFGTVLPKDMLSKAGKLSLEVELDPSKFVDIVGKRKQTQSSTIAEPEPSAEEATHALMADYDSIYFNTTQYLVQICAPQKTPDKPEGEAANPGLRFVVLIDDLDRCLPEKAVEMLESIKLFLDIPAFAFVIGVDNEVIERGIMHRYKDYVSVPVASGNTSQDASANEGQHLDSQLRMPITGSEYLEKIIHLPVHLSYQTGAQATDLLQVYRQRYDDVLQKIGPFNGKPVDADVALGLIVRITPPVPRKLIRLAESGLFELHRLVDCLGVNQDDAALFHQINPYLVLRLQALQLFYPALHRLLKKDALTWSRLSLSDRRVSDGVLTYNGQRLHDLEKALARAERGDRANDENHQEAKAKLERRLDVLSVEDAKPLSDRLQDEVAFMRALTYSCQQRGADNPLALFAEDAAYVEGALVNQALLGWGSNHRYPIYLYPQQAPHAPSLKTITQKLVSTEGSNHLFEQLQTLWLQADPAAFEQDLANFDMRALGHHPEAANSALRQFARLFDPAKPDYRKWLINPDMLTLTKGSQRISGHMLRWHAWAQRLRGERLFTVWDEEQQKLRAQADMVWVWRDGKVGGSKVYSPRYKSVWTSTQSQNPNTACELAQDLVTSHVWRRYAEGQTWDAQASLPIGDAKEFRFGEGDFAWPDDTVLKLSNDWQVPARLGLSSLVEQAPGVEEKLATIDPVAFPKCPKYWFWSSSPNAYSSGYAWGVGFDGSYDGYSYKYDANRVRLVRSGQ